MICLRLLGGLMIVGFVTGDGKQRNRILKWPREEEDLSRSKHLGVGVGVGFGFGGGGRGEGEWNTLFHFGI